MRCVLRQFIFYSDKDLCHVSHHIHSRHKICLVHTGRYAKSTSISIQQLSIRPILANTNIIGSVLLYRKQLALCHDSLLDVCLSGSVQRRQKTEGDKLRVRQKRTGEIYIDNQLPFDFH